MKEYTIYDPTTGKILRTGVTNGNPDVKVKAGQCIIYTRTLNPTTKRVVNGRIVEA